MKLTRLLALAVLLMGIVGPLVAQTAEIPRRTETINWTSGRHNGNPNATGEDPGQALQEVVSIGGVPWMQLVFRKGNLGRQSFIEIKSLHDGATQRLDRVSLAQSNNRSAYFNGAAVEVRLFVGRNDRNVSIDVPEVVVGEWGPPGQGKSICGVDNRVASTEPRSARIDPIGCTGWIIDSGQHLSAGHCLAGGSSNQTLSFLPPQSLPDGTVQFPPPDRQYTIIQSSFDFVNGGVGNDWGVFAVNNNSQTGLQPIAAQGSFTVKQDFGPANIRITGYGVDDGSTNQTLQTDVGPNTGSSGTTMRYATDTTGGNSGSPVIDEATGEAVGIHTHGGCSGGNNSGTSFFNSALWNAIDTAPPPPPPPPADCPAGSVDLTGMVSYSNQNASNGMSNPNNETITLTGNTWKRTTQTFNITANTMVEFTFSSTDQGEIHAIGFDADDTLNDEPAHCQFWGTQNWTGTGNIGNDACGTGYSGSGTQSFTYPIGQFITGTRFLVLTNDDDAAASANGTFSCVRVFEDGGPPPPPPGGCTVDDDFEANTDNWTNSGASTCSTGTYVDGNPTQQTSTVVTQPAGSASGVHSIFTATNSTAGNADVDGGNCIVETITPYAVAAASTLSISYFHGQRDTGDDPSGDFFNVQWSDNGGATWNNVVSNGDTRSVAAWATATAQVPAGNIDVRVQCSDGSGPGDIVECGIDDLSICDN